MPKLKTHKLLTKRIRLSKHGKLKFKKPGLRHLMSGKSGKRRRHMRRVGALEGTLANKLRVALGGPRALPLPRETAPGAAATASGASPTTPK
ncbi:MAG: 50S ribosomal protein L35 [Planctomycetes bacterium]|nr:50S ribosomal protein L35 [Planctomycetota bacterium]